MAHFNSSIDDFDILPNFKQNLTDNPKTSTENCQNSLKPVKKPQTLTRKRKKSPKNLALNEEKQRQKLLKTEQKSFQPKQAMKFMQILFDSNISRKLDQKGTIVKTLQEIIDCPEFGILPNENLSIDNLISWRRRNANSPDLFTIESEYCLLISDQTTDLNLSRDQTRFLSILRQYREILPQKSKIHLIFYDFSLFNDQQLFEICILANVNYHRSRDLTELGQFLAKFTKSISEKVFKQRKKDLETFLSFVPSADNYKNLIKADKQGDQTETKKFWWRKMLQVAAGSKPNAENACKSICAKYPTISHLIKAYRSLNSEKDCELMLQNLIADDLTGVRVGPAISTCIYLVFMKNDPNLPVDKPKLLKSA